MVLQIKLVVIVVVRTLGRGNVEVMGSNPVEVLEFFSVNLQLLKLQLRQRQLYLHLNV